MENKDFRTGNILEYRTAEGDWLETKLDWQDFKWLEEDPSGFQSVHRFIPLTSELLERFGFTRVENGFTVFENIKGPYYALDALLLWQNGSEPKDQFLVYYADQMFGKYQAVFSRWIGTAHELQNIYHAWKGTELTLK